MPMTTGSVPKGLMGAPRRRAGPDSQPMADRRPGISQPDRRRGLAFPRNPLSFGKSSMAFKEGGSWAR
jgi:hypothetical protein